MDILVKGVYKRFGEKRVLEDFSCTFKQGGVACVMGPSGCGKTTLLNLLMGFLSPDAGEITGVPERLGAVFQEDRLIPSLPVNKNIRLVTGKRVSDAEIERALEAIGLAGSAGARAETLSGGMKRRVALVRAILSDPQLLLLDEPLKGLDADNRQTVIRYLSENARGRTVIMVTHDPADAEAMRGDVIHMAAK